MTDPTTAAERLRRTLTIFQERMLNEALAEAAAPYRDLLDELRTMTREDDDSAPLWDELPVEWTDRVTALLRREVGE